MHKISTDGARNPSHHQAIRVCVGVYVCSVCIGVYVCMCVYVCVLLCLQVCPCMCACMCACVRGRAAANDNGMYVNGNPLFLLPVNSLFPARRIIYSLPSFRGASTRISFHEDLIPRPPVSCYLDAQPRLAAHPSFHRGYLGI